MAVRRSGGKPEYQKRIAEERISRLFELAEKEFRTHPERSRRYVQLARKIAMRYTIQVPKAFKRKFCKKCYMYLVPGINSRVRTNARQHAVIIKCLACGNVMRFPYRRERAGKG